MCSLSQLPFGLVIVFAAGSFVAFCVLAFSLFYIKYLKGTTSWVILFLAIVAAISTAILTGLLLFGSIQAVRC